MDTIKIKFKNEDNFDELKFPDISYDYFLKYIWGSKKNYIFSGASDIDYDYFKKENKMKEISDFNSETTKDILLIVENEYRERVLIFECIYDSDNDENFNFMKKG